MILMRVVRVVVDINERVDRKETREKKRNKTKVPEIKTSEHVRGS